MNVKPFLPVFFCLFVIISCKNGNEGRGNDSHTDTEYPPTARDIPRTDESTEENQDTNTVPVQTGTNVEGRKSTGGTTSSIKGNYIKMGEESDSNCNCYCLDINFSSNSDLCLQEDSLYISTRYEKNQDNSIHIYFVGPSSNTTGTDDIPWEDFDRNLPIATITSKSNGELELDWLGFTINGDLAMDYAILGKKSLEGSYKKK